MKFDVMAQGDSPLVVAIEPYGTEYVLAPGDHLVFEWLDLPDSLHGSIEHEAGRITVGVPNARSRVWNSQGDELSIYGGSAPTSVDT
jgi:hypothetical protein